MYAVVIGTRLLGVDVIDWKAYSRTNGFSRLPGGRLAYFKTAVCRTRAAFLASEKQQDCRQAARLFGNIAIAGPNTAWGQRNITELQGEIWYSRLGMNHCRGPSRHLKIVKIKITSLLFALLTPLYPMLLLQPQQSDEAPSFQHLRAHASRPSDASQAQ